MLIAALVIAATPLSGPGWTVVPGAVPSDRQPDGNSVVLDAPDGLIVVDTGRHAEQQEKLLALAKERGKPIAAIVNTHWHLDHSGGNAELRAVFPKAPIIASTTIEGALAGFLPESRKGAEAYIASGKAAAAQVAEIRGDFAAMDAPAHLRPTIPVTRSGKMTIAGRKLTVNLAPYAATEGDVWLHDAKTGLVIAGDLVVGIAPFMDTACADGWRRALDAITATRFTTLIPGHGDPMTRADFLDWRRAFTNLLDCAASDTPKTQCITGWQRDAARFIPAGDTSVPRRIGYYIDTRLRAAPAQKYRYCAVKGR